MLYLTARSEIVAFDGDKRNHGGDGCWSCTFRWSCTFCWSCALRCGIYGCCGRCRRRCCVCFFHIVELSRYSIVSILLDKELRSLPSRFRVTLIWRSSAFCPFFPVFSLQLIEEISSGRDF